MREGPHRSEMYRVFSRMQGSSKAEIGTGRFTTERLLSTWGIVQRCNTVNIQAEFKIPGSYEGPCHFVQKGG
jgi:hypothetical protein